MPCTQELNTVINAKEAELRNRGMDLGPRRDQQDAGWGGCVRIFDQCRIYAHPQIGVHEVHGGILSKYLAMGGPGQDPVSGKRLFGFPVSDETSTKDGYYAASFFEWGTLYWAHGGVAVYGDFYAPFKEYGEFGELDHPLTDPVPAFGGLAQYFKRGCRWQPRGGGPPLLCKLSSTGRIGKPLILQPSKAADLALRVEWGPIAKTRHDLLTLHPNPLLELWRDRIVLKRVGLQDQPPEIINVTVADVTERETSYGLFMQVGLETLEASKLRDRTLYDVALRLPSGAVVTAIPHAIYAKESWERFGLIHATDLHASRRLDGFYEMLMRSGRPASAQQHNNYNDAIRDLIRYANRLHRLGMLDGILCTGDLIDFVFENGDDRKGGGNFIFLERLLLGLERSRKDGAAPAEELRVPLFTCLGNHDYRPNPYYFDMKVDVKLWWDYERQDYKTHNLTQDDARAVQGERQPKISEEEGLAIVKIEEPAFYFRRIGDNSSYILNLGRHRVVMLETKYDIGSPEDKLDVLKTKFGFNTEAKANTFAGGIDQFGLSYSDLLLVRKALEEAGEKGVVMIGMHAPPLNPKGDEYAHYFRETEHPALDSLQKLGYLRRRAAGLPGDLLQRFKGWAVAGTPYFKKGEAGDMLDFGVSRANRKEFLELCVGRGAPRPVDLVLSGHVHNHVEFRLRWEQEPAFLFYMDFYSENPSEYYASSEIESAADFSPTHTYVNIRPGAPAKGVYVSGGPVRTVEVPPYSDPLNDTPDPRTWWARHRPLITQTAAIGPLDRTQRVEHREPTFQGFRYIHISGDAITQIRNIRLAELRQRNFQMPWEEQLRFAGNANRQPA